LDEKSLSYYEDQSNFVRGKKPKGNLPLDL